MRSPFFILFWTVLHPGFGGQPVIFSPQEKALASQHKAAALPPHSDNRFGDDPAAAHFGQFLFFETRLSQNGAISCATCHIPSLGFADALPLAKGLQETDRHTPGLAGVAFNRWFFWDGRADSLWAQALQPIENDKEMGGDRLQAIWLVYGNPEMRAGYEAVFGAMPELNRTDFPDHAAPKNGDHPYNQAWLAMSQESRQTANQIFANLGKAIAAYERLLLSKNSRFDTFLEGLETNDTQKMAALNHSEQRGLKLFLGKARCRFCHSGPNFTDLEFHNTGVAPLRDGLPADSGRYAGVEKVQANPFNAAGKYSHDPKGARARNLRFLKKSPEQWGQFKTPGLRDVAATPPYMHQGQLPSLEAVVVFYNKREGSIPTGHHQDPLLQPLNLTAREEQDLTAFLKSLSGEPLKPQLLRKPASAIPSH